MFTYSVTFDVVTPESAEIGDFAESGFVVEDETAESIAELADAVRDHCGHVELNSSMLPRGGVVSVSLYGTDGDMDYSDASETRRALHVTLPADDARALVRLLIGRGLLPSYALRA